MIDNLMVAVEAEAKRRNHEVVAWALRAAREREEQEQQAILNNPGCDFDDRLNMLIYGGDS